LIAGDERFETGLLGFVEQMYAPPRQFGATLRFGFKQ